MSNVPSKLASGWMEVAIEDLFAPLGDGRTLHQGWSPQCAREPSASEDYWGVLKTTAIQAGAFLAEHNKLLPTHLSPRPLLAVKEGDFLLTCAGPRVRCGVSCLVRRTRSRLMISGKMYRFRVRTDGVEPHYLEALLQTEEARAAIDRMKTGISDSGLNLTHDRFRRLPVRVAPLAEQRRIVAKIEELFTRLDAGVAALKRVKQQIKRYRQAVLRDAFTGELTRDWRERELRNPDSPLNREPVEKLLARIVAERRLGWERAERARMKAKGRTPSGDRWRCRYKEPCSPLEADLPELPATWRWVTVEAVSSKVVDGVHRKPNYVPDGVPFVTVRNLTAGDGISFANLNHITEEDHRLFTLRADPERGDILVSKDGTLAWIIRALGAHIHAEQL